MALVSGYIEEEHFYTAHCPDCPWWGSQTTSESEAEEELNNHDREHHAS